MIIKFIIIRLNVQGVMHGYESGGLTRNFDVVYKNFMQHRNHFFLRDALSSFVAKFKFR